MFTLLHQLLGDVKWVFFFWAASFHLPVSALFQTFSAISHISQKALNLNVISFAGLHKHKHLAALHLFNHWLHLFCFLQPTFCVNHTRMCLFHLGRIFFKFDFIAEHCKQHVAVALLIFFCSQTGMTVIICEQKLNHNTGSSQVSAFRCSSAQRSWCSRVRLLERVFTWCLMPAGAWGAWLLDNYPQEYRNPPPNSKRGLQKCSTSPATVFKQYFRVDSSFNDEPALSPVLPPKARAWEGAQKERM